jgi:hypothetical protein
MAAERHLRRRPLNGGVTVGGRFAAEALKVPHMQVVAMPQAGGD